MKVDWIVANSPSLTHLEELHTLDLDLLESLPDDRVTAKIGIFLTRFRERGACDFTSGDNTNTA